MQKARGRTIGGWFLSDEIWRKVEVELADVHVRDDLI